MFIGLGNTIPGPKGQFGISADFSYPVTSWCKDDGNKTPIISGASGGVFTFTTTDGSSNVLVWENPASPSTTSDDGIINTTATPAGSYEITYTVQGLSNSVEITITADVSTTFTYPNGENRFTILPTKADPSISGDFAITTNPGNLSINTTTGAIDLSTATAGQTYTVTFTPTGTPCGNSTTASFTVVQAFQSFEFTVQMAQGETFTIPTTGSGYSYRVNWGLNNNNNLTNFVGQGNSTSGNNYTGNATSPPYNAGTYTIQIGDYGNTFPRAYFKNAVDKLKLKNITKWGEFQWNSFSEAFYGCTNLDISATDTPDLTNCNDFYNAFYNCRSLTGTLSGVNWNWTFPVSNTTFRGMFYRANVFNGDISNWNTQNVTSFRSMFSCYSVATGVFNRNLNSWNTSNVTSMYDMFQNQSFNGDISSWDTSSVTTMSYMFLYCSSFNQDINTKDYTAGNRLAWDVSSCTGFLSMFSGASSFNTSIDKWKIKTTGSAFSMSSILSNTAYNQALNTSEVTVGQGGYQQTYLAWDVQNVNDFSSMLLSTSFNQSLSNWDTSSATSMSQFLMNAPFNQPINTQSVTVGSGSNQRTYNAWDVSLVNNTFRMFRGATSFNQDLSSWNTQSFLNAGEMFYQANAFDQNISSWDINQVTNFANFMLGVTLSTTNYDALLTAWDAQGAMSYSGTADFGNSVPSCDNVASNGAFAARASLITKWGGITDKFSQNNTCQPLAGFDYASNAYCTNASPSTVDPTIIGTPDSFSYITESYSVAQTFSGLNGQANTGGGGGGGASRYPSSSSMSANGSSGGSGIVILKYPTNLNATFSAGLTKTDTVSGSDTITSVTAGTGTVTFANSGTLGEYLIVAGGGGGGGSQYNSGFWQSSGAGGGAGGLLTATNLSVSAQSYNITVGLGGAGGLGVIDNSGTTKNCGETGTSGQNSIFSSFTAVGGGGGGGGTHNGNSGTYACSNGDGLNGGSGGGAGGVVSGNSAARTAGTGTTGQGNSGGGPGSGRSANGGGGAGAAGSGGAVNSSPGGDGGIGVISSITGTATYYAGGGGGGGYWQNSVGDGTGGNGGTGGGGAGGTSKP